MGEVRQYPIRCDFCNAAPPEWMWDVPPGTPLLTLYDRQTGHAEQAQSEGKLSACDGCRRLIESSVIRNKGRILAARMFRHDRVLAGMKGPGRKGGMRGLARMYGRLLGLLENKRPYERGHGDGLYVELDPPAPPEMN